MKGKILPDHIPVNKFQLLVIGLPILTITEISGLEDELEIVTLPDRTKATGGNSIPSEFTVMTPAHHMIEQKAWEKWYKEGKEPVSPTYKKTATLVMRSLSGQLALTRSLVGLFVSKRKDPDGEMANEGEMATVEWTLQVDDILPLP